METITTIAAVRERVHAWHREGLRIAFVPTMGNLHPGHVSLIEAARQHGDRFIASIFVNPMQFGPNEDFAHYPRTPTQDERMLAAAGCNLMFMPDVAEIYPNGAERATRIDVPGPPTPAAVLDALEARYPVLRGTIRDHVTHERRAFIRFFACSEDLSHDSPDTPLPASVAHGDEPFIILGAIAGG